MFQVAAVKKVNLNMILSWEVSESDMLFQEFMSE